MAAVALLTFLGVRWQSTPTPHRSAATILNCWANHPRPHITEQPFNEEPHQFSV